MLTGENGQIPSLPHPSTLINTWTEVMWAWHIEAQSTETLFYPVNFYQEFHLFIGENNNAPPSPKAYMYSCEIDSVQRFKEKFLVTNEKRERGIEIAQ